MKKLLIILILFFCVNFCYADFSNLSFHQPRLGNTELYKNNVCKGLKIKLKVEHSYMRMGSFITPFDFHGESELYDLGFYFDMDKNISNRNMAEAYRVLYRSVDIGEVIPEPCTLFLLGFGGIIFCAKNKK